ncbi:MAG: hypothetical protein RLZZ471_885 [Actinomycetota bacterium]|jgi:basic membrane lipoprotein Med (substrate-binding protein (PBP1-ABC) superfamily)
MRRFAALALVLALTGCAAQTPAPSITPVSLKYCAISDSAGFNDDGLNRSVYAALQQLKVQTGARVSALEVGAKVTAESGIQKLVAAKCNAIITAGGSLVEPTLTAAKANDTIRFVSVSDTTELSDTAPNFVALSFKVDQAAYSAGYLAALSSADSGQVSVLNLIGDSVSRKSVKAFAAGVERFNSEKRAQVKVAKLTSFSETNKDVTFVLAGSSEAFGVEVGSYQGKIIGYGRDWFTDSRNKAIKPNILTSVIRNDVIGKVVAAVTQSNTSTIYDLSNQGVGLSESHDLNWPASFANSQSQIIKDFVDGKVRAY